jgi:hypothetical protein
MLVSRSAFLRALVIGLRDQFPMRWPCEYRFAPLLPGSSPPVDSPQLCAWVKTANRASTGGWVERIIEDEGVACARYP